MIEECKATLNEQLDVERVKFRQESWSSNGVPYLTSEDIIRTANRVFGFDGWDYKVKELDQVSHTKLTKNNKTGIELCYKCVIAVRISGAGAEETVREDVGFGTGVSYAGEGAAHESAGKEAVSDALKRAFRTFGDQFGNCLYNKTWVAANLDGAASLAAASSSDGETGKKKEWKGGTLKGEVTEKQINFINRKLGEKSLTLTDAQEQAKVDIKPIDELTKQEASSIIDFLNQG